MSKEDSSKSNTIFRNLVIPAVISGSVIMQTSANPSANDVFLNKSLDEKVHALDAKDRDQWQQPEKVLQVIGELRDKTVLDLGAGSGYFSLKLVYAGARVIAADIDPTLLQTIQQKARQQGIDQQKLEVRQVNESDAGLSEQEVDVILTVDTYHHFDNRIAYFSELKQGLKPDGKLVVVDYKKHADIKQGPDFHHRIAAKQVIDELTEAGYQTIRLHQDVLPKQYIIEAFKQKQQAGTEWMRQQWNKEYASKDYVFGTEPDPYFKQAIDGLTPGKLLLPGEGEGRNAVYAARSGWQVTAYDYSDSAKVKADALAEKHSVAVDYQVMDILTGDFKPEEYDMVAFMFVHFEDPGRQQLHHKLDMALKPGGVMLIQNFSTEHPQYNQAGPQQEKNLYSAGVIKRDFPGYRTHVLAAEKIVMQAGENGMGDSSVLRFIGYKPKRNVK